MKKVTLLSALLVTMLSLEAQAAPNQLFRFYQDIKLPSQKVLELDSWTLPVAQDTVRILSHVAGPTSGSLTTVSSFSAQPDFARNLILTPEAGPSGLSAVDQCAVVIRGTDIRGQALMEVLNTTNDSGAALTGSLAFKTVTSVQFNSGCESGSFDAKWNLGVGVKFGLKGCINGSGDVAWTATGNVFDATRATIATGGSTSVGAATVQFNQTPNGVTSYKAYYIQNYACP